MMGFQVSVFRYLKCMHSGSSNQQETHFETHRKKLCLGNVTIPAAGVHFRPSLVLFSSFLKPKQALLYF